MNWSSPLCWNSNGSGECIFKSGLLQYCEQQIRVIEVEERHKSRKYSGETVRSALSMATLYGLQVRGEAVGRAAQNGSYDAYHLRTLHLYFWGLISAGVQHKFTPLWTLVSNKHLWFPFVSGYNHHASIAALNRHEHSVSLSLSFGKRL